MRFGLEKEGLRVDRETSKLAQTPHPKALGSALTHPHITTDYSEALLEFVTGIHASPQAAIQELEELHAFASTVLGNERIWPLSMPCQLPDSDADIPLAYYGITHRAAENCLPSRTRISLWPANANHCWGAL